MDWHLQRPLHREGRRDRFMLTVIAALVLALAPPARQITRNFSVNLAGTPDTRPGTWGNAAFDREPIVFHPPAGYRTRILAIHGDFVAYPMAGSIAAGSALVGWGAKTSAPDDEDFTNTLIWIQDGLTP